MCVFGRPIRDFIPIHPVKYQPHTTWRETLSSREEALRNRHMRAAERLSEHTRTLPPLAVGDCVRIQNQTGPHPTKWDKTGVVVEVRQFDQYVVRVDGSRRVTLRNRKFLRQYLPVVPRAPLPLAPGPTAVSSSPPTTRPTHQDSRTPASPAQVTAPTSRSSAPPLTATPRPHHSGPPSTQDDLPDPTPPSPAILAPPLMPAPDPPFTTDQDQRPSPQDSSSPLAAQRARTQGAADPRPSISASLHPLLAFSSPASLNTTDLTTYGAALHGPDTVVAALNTANCFCLPLHTDVAFQLYYSTYN